METDKLNAIVGILRPSTLAAILADLLHYATEKRAEQPAWDIPYAIEKATVTLLAELTSNEGGLQTLMDVTADYAAGY